MCCHGNGPTSSADKELVCSISLSVKTPQVDWRERRRVGLRLGLNYCLALDLSR